MRGSGDKVSIVLPVHNGAKYLQRSVESCLKQTYTDFELIIVDDGSTDETPDVIAAFTDERIHCLRHEENRGLPGALNTGFEHATGGFLTWTSDDNLYLPEALEKMVEHLKGNEKTALVYAGCHQIDDDGKVIGVVEQGGPEQLYCYNCVGACFMYRREVYDALGKYSEEFTLLEDQEYWLRASLEFRLERLDEILYLCRTHAGSLTSRYGYTPIMHEQVRKLRRKFLIPWLKRYIFFMDAEKKRNPAQAAAHLIRSFYRHPALWRKVLYVAATYPKKWGRSPF